MVTGMLASPATGITTIAGMEFAHILGGTFTMGRRDLYQAPLRQTTVGDFRMGVTPVTNADMNTYIAAMGNDSHGVIGVDRNGREHILARGPDGKAKTVLLPEQHPHLRGVRDIVKFYDNVRLVPEANRYQTLSSEVFARANHPAVIVSWREAVAFAAWVSHVSGILVRLPTEAEWEFAAKGGIGNSHDYATPDGNLWDSLGNLQAHVGHWKKSDKLYGTSAVRTYGANPLGLYDLSGNVWEWIMDLYGVYDMQATDNPTGPSEGQTRVVRGGSWFNNEEGALSAQRRRESSENRDGMVGFRLLSPLAPQDSKPA